MSRRSTYGELHNQENLNRWEWKAQGNSHLMIVPLPGYEDELYSLRGRRPFYALNAICSMTALLSILLNLGLFGSTVAGLSAKIPGVMLLFFAFAVFLGGSIRIAKGAGTSPLYRQRIPWRIRDKRNPAMVPTLNSYSTAYANSLNYQKHRMAQGNKESQKEYAKDTKYLHRNFFEQMHKEWSLRKYVEKGNNLNILMYCSERYRDEIRPELIAAAPKKETQRQVINPKQLTGNLTPVPQSLGDSLRETAPGEKGISLSVPNADPQDENAPRGQEVLSFYDALSAKGYPTKQLTTATKRWGEISRRDRDNLVLLMDELSPMLGVLEEAETLERGELLEKAREALRSNLGVAEEVAERINAAVDQSHLDSMQISGTFLKDKFHPKRMAMEELLER